MAIWIILLIFNFAYVFYDTVAKEPKRSQTAWLYGYSESITYIAPMLSTYDEVLVTNSYAQDPGPLLLFFLIIHPQTFWQSDSSGSGLVFRNWIENINNIKIGQINYPVSNKQQGKILFIATPKEVESLPTEIMPEFLTIKTKPLPAYKILKSVDDYNGDVVLQVGRFIRYDENGQPIEE